MARVDTQFPVRPNGVVINYIAIDGGVLDTPTLVETEGDVSLDGGKYSMVVSRFEVGYDVLECGNDMGLLVGSYGDKAVAVERVSMLCYCICRTPLIKSLFYQGTNQG